MKKRKTQRRTNNNQYSMFIRILFLWFIIYAFSYNIFLFKKHVGVHFSLPMMGRLYYILSNHYIYLV